MTTRIESGGPVSNVSVGATAPRVTPPPARPFSEVMGAGAQAVVQGAESAIRRLPGGPILAAPLRPMASGAPVSNGTSAEGPSGTAGDSGLGGSTAANNVEDVLSRNADQNLYYLELQERISDENRSYSALSNVLKARHETVKNVIGNIR